MIDQSPADFAGVTAVIVVSLTTANEVAFVSPNVSRYAPENAVPRMVTAVPPVVGPVLGVTEVIVMAGARYVNAVRVPTPLSVVTETLASPAEDAAGVIAEMVVLFVMEKDDAGTPPNDTAVAPVKLVPVIVTVVPPASGPLPGLIWVTVGCRLRAACAVAIPTPQAVGDTQVPAAKGDVTAVSWALACLSPHVGFADMMRASTPATCGAAMLVP